MGRRRVTKARPRGSGCSVPSPGAGVGFARRGGPAGPAPATERGPLPGRRRHRQQLPRFPVAVRHHPGGRFCSPARTISKSPAWPTLSPARRLSLIRARTAKPRSSRRLARQAAPRWALPPMQARPLSRSPARRVSAPARPSPLTVARTLRRRLSPLSPVAAAAEAAFGGRFNHCRRAAHDGARGGCPGFRQRHHPHHGIDQGACQRGAGRRQRSHSRCAQPVYHENSVRML